MVCRQLQMLTLWQVGELSPPSEQTQELSTEGQLDKSGPGPRPSACPARRLQWLVRTQ